MALYEGVISRIIDARPEVGKSYVPVLICENATYELKYDSEFMDIIEGGGQASNVQVEGEVYSTDNFQFPLVLQVKNIIMLK